MKILGIAAALMMISAANAESAYVRYESVTFQANSAWVPANYTCLNNEGDIVKVKGNYFRKCVDNSTGNRSGCTDVLERVIPQPVVSTFVRYENCSGKEDDQNCDAVSYQVNQSKMPIYRVSGREGSVETLIGWYTIPSCAMAPPVPAN